MASQKQLGWPAELDSRSLNLKVDLYQRRMLKAYTDLVCPFLKSEVAVSKVKFDPVSRWFKFGCLYPEIAWLTGEIREFFYEIQEGGDDDDETIRSTESPLQYMTWFYSKVIPRWEAYLRDWPPAIIASPSSMAFFRAKFDSLCENIKSMESYVNMLSNASIDCHVGDIYQIDLDELQTIERDGVLEIEMGDTIKAVQRPYQRLRRLEPQLRAVFEDAEAFLAEHNESSGLRRRHIRQELRTAATENTDSQRRESGPLSTREVDSTSSDQSSLRLSTFAAKIDKFLGAAESRLPWVVISQRALRQSFGWLDVSQATLWTLAMATGVLSAMAATISALQSRPAECIPSFNSPDDSTWALVAQIPVQLFSLYTTMLPIITDKRLSVRPFWFVIGLSLSALMTIISPVVYGSSWRASTLLTYFSSISAMICTTQLAGSVMASANSEELVK